MTTIYRESLYFNTMIKFGIPRKLIALTKMCMKETQFQIRVELYDSETFTVETGLK